MDQPLKLNRLCSSSSVNFCTETEEESQSSPIRVPSTEECSPSQILKEHKGSIGSDWAIELECTSPMKN